MRDSSKFWDKIATRYAKKPVADEQAYQKKLRVTREYFRPDMHVLEVGCGTGSTAIAHAPFVQHIRATDFSSQMITIAQGKASAADIGNVSFEVSSVDELSVQSNSLDAVLALSVLHLLESKEEAIGKIHNMLKPGGVFVSSTACIGDFLKILKFIAPVGRFFRLLPVLKVFTTNELVNSLTTAGFTIDYQWQPSKKDAVFIVAKKAA